ncbi:MAG: hypothetical protein JW746_04295 [Candidatus Krumholzibacteriota bacterium]|nr:hypothetical protein [Candidatus Krumholzibacteriota bacterium]
MMIRKIAAVLMVCLLAGSVFSPLQAMVHFDLGGGVAMPTGDLNDYWGMGPVFSGTILFPATPFVSIGANFGFSKMAFDHDTFADAIGEPDLDLSGGDLSVLNVCAELRVHAGAMEMAYIFGGAGLGLYNIGLSDLTDGNETLEFDRENKVGGYIHAGFAMPITPMIKLGLKGQFNFYKVDKNEDLDEYFAETQNFFSLMGILIIGLD